MFMILNIRFFNNTYNFFAVVKLIRNQLASKFIAENVVIKTANVNT